MARQYGLQSSEDLTGVRLPDLLVPDDPKNLEYIRAFIESGYRLTAAESHVRAADGGDVYFSNNLVGIVEDGRLVRAWGTQRDVTADRADTRATAYLAAIVESSDDAIISKNLDGIITSWNVAAERIFGYHGEEAIGQHITLLIPERLRAEEDDIIGRIRRGLKVDHFETIRQRKDGTEFPVALTVSPIRDRDGRIIGASKIARDMTERRRAEAIAERYRLLSERAKDIIWILRPDGRLLEVNQAAVNAYGYSREELLGMNVSQLRAPSTRDSLGEHLSEASSRNINFESVHVRRDGNTFPVEVAAGAGVLNGEKLIYAIVRDITERKEHEDALTHNQIRLSMALRGSRTGVWERDLGGDTVWWSPELEEIFGLQRGGFRGTEEHFYELMHEDDRQEAWSEVETAIVEHRPYAIEFRFHHADGSVRWMEGRGEAVYSTDGKPIRLYGTGTDITERKLRELNMEFLAEISADLSV
jgi:PAS domain S-box-containing protein